MLRIKQKEIINLYFKQLRSRLEMFIQERQKYIENMLESEKYKTIELLKNARISRDFVNIDQSLFKICFRAY
jgi:hypothetical protein